MLGSLNISDTDLKMNISLDTTLSKCCLAAKRSDLPLTSLISQLNLELLPLELNPQIAGSHSSASLPLRFTSPDSAWRYSSHQWI